MHCGESQCLLSREARFPLLCKCMITTDVSPSHLHAKGQYSAFPKGRSRRKWPIREPTPSTEVLSWTSSSSSLFKHLVAQSVHLIKREISFPPVGSAAIHLSLSTYRDRFGRRCLFLFPPTSLHLPGLEGVLCGHGLSWRRRCQVSWRRSQNVSIGELLACSIQKAGHSSQVL